MIFLAKGVESINNIEITDSTKICANPACQALFNPTRHNQKYCKKECCKVVTNAKIMEQYYEQKDRKAGVKRTCKSCKITPLSRYNEGSICQSCQLKKQSQGRAELLQLIGVA